MFEEKILQNKTKPMTDKAKREALRKLLLPLIGVRMSHAHTHTYAFVLQYKFSFLYRRSVVLQSNLMPTAKIDFSTLCKPGVIGIVFFGKQPQLALFSSR